LQKLIDKGAVARIGGHAAGGSVRLLDEAGIFQGRQVVAHRGRAHTQAVPLGQRARADGQGELDVVLDERAQHPLASLRQHRLSSRGGSNGAESRELPRMITC
jgi:hypothetical protein